MTAQIFPVFFQAAGYALKSSFLTILRTVILFVPLGWLLARLGGLRVRSGWFFPSAEILTHAGRRLCATGSFFDRRDGPLTSVETERR